jgi:hypothetical protein
MIPMRVAAINGLVLTYDVDDVEDVKISTPNDAIETTQPDDTARHWKLGKSHLDLHIDFKEGTRARWVDQATAALPDLRRGGETLRAALDAEGIPADVASRIWNRFFYGQPWGLDMPPMTPEQADAWKEQELAAQTSPDGQSPVEQFAAAMDSVMLASARRHFGDKMADRMKERMGMEGK